MDLVCQEELNGIDVLLQLMDSNDADYTDVLLVTYQFQQLCITYKRNANAKFPYFYRVNTWNHYK